MKHFLSNQVTACSSFAKISKLISWAKHFRNNFNSKFGHFLGHPVSIGIALLG